MKTYAALLLTLASITGCSMTHGDPSNPKKNPHPAKRYEVTATADAPGPWDSVKGYITYEVNNPKCVPRGSLTGGQNVPNTGYDIEMTRAGDNTWKGHFYRDALQDADYFELGVCHWDVMSVGMVFVVRGEAFSTSFLLGDFLEGPQTSYFKKSAYGDVTLVHYGAQDYSGSDSDVIRHPDAYFPIKVTVTENTP